MTSADLEPYVLTAMTTTGGIVSVCLDLGADELAVDFAQQGLRAARLLGLYRDEEEG